MLTYSHASHRPVSIQPGLSAARQSHAHKSSPVCKTQLCGQAFKGALCRLACRHAGMHTFRNACWHCDMPDCWQVIVLCRCVAELLSCCAAVVLWHSGFVALGW